MANTIYTARAHVTGGRAEGHGRTSDGALEVDLRLPAEMGGSGGGTNPEQLFAVGYAACFEGALGVVARRGARRPTPEMWRSSLRFRWPPTARAAFCCRYRST
jgi:Ohr subfamily peroxiredoxin